MVAPTTPATAGEYKVYATFTSTSGTPAEFLIVDLKIDCVVTSFTKPNNPTTGLTYKLFYPPLAFDFNQDWVQVPACGHVFTDSFTWTGLNTYIVQDTSSLGRITVDTAATAAVGTHAVELTNTATVTRNSAFLGGSSAAFAPANALDKVSFTITIEDPCRTTTVNDIVMTGAGTAGAYTISVVDGTTGTFTFVRPTTTVETETGIAAVCGTTSYSIHNSNSGGTFSYNAAWAVITGPTTAGVYTMTIDTNQDLTLIAAEASVTHNMFIKATLDDYTTYTREVYTAVNIVITQAGCDCSALAWDVPTTGVDVTSSSIMAGTSTSAQVMIKPDANTGAQSTNAAF